MFQTLRAGSPFYILEKGSDIKLKIAEVSSVSAPTPKFQTGNFTPNFGQEMIVDITAKCGDESLEFKQVPANLSIANFGTGNVVISESRDAMSAEVESMRRASQSILDSIEHNQQVVGRCGEFLALLNPQIAKEREQEQKIQNLEKEMNGMRTDLSDIKGLLLSMSEANKK